MVRFQNCRNTDLWCYHHMYFTMLMFFLSHHPRSGAQCLKNLLFLRYIFQSNLLYLGLAMLHVFHVTPVDPKVTI